MKISILENGNEIRKVFKNKFTFEANDKTFNKNERYLWEFMEHRVISFKNCIKLLRSVQGEVYFMSEHSDVRCTCDIEIDGVKYKNIVAKADASELAELIEYEWIESWKLMAHDEYLITTLPDDLYVFDASMEHLIVFTHENDHWELERTDPIKCAKSRFCMMYGFNFPVEYSYENIRAMLEKEVSKNSVLEFELSFSSPKYFYHFTIYKRVNDDQSGYLYYLDFDLHTKYNTLDELESAKVFNMLSLKDVSRLQGVSFEIVSVEDKILI